MATAIKNYLWTCNIMTFCLLIKYCLLDKRRTFIKYQMIWYFKSPFENDLKASVQLGEFTMFVLFSSKENSTVARSAIFSTPSTSLPEAIFFSPAGHNQLPLESLDLSSTGVVVSTHWDQLLRLGLVLVRD